MGYEETLFTVLRSGNELDLRDPDPDAVNFDDIVGNLASITRYVGSQQNVAQHCLYVADHLRDQDTSRAVQLHGLLHDAQEAYLGDVPRPTKNLDSSFESTLDQYEEKVLKAIYKALRLEPPSSTVRQRVKQADTEVALIELHVLGTESVLSQTVDRFPGWTQEKARELIDRTDWWQERNWDEDGENAGSLFRKRFNELTGNERPAVPC
ncbi:MAG: hypothetical protein SVU32_01580, partial [Candidatus Nanohaloarchaea archaeon]|nr:hypothetical protein [Candidatus Nanohaloarchaea archaeon]